ncbi:MAG: nucleotidyltransferase domain-containing protein [Spirochaetaceae bacterium]|nr:nucleotidyltransferase domain-containing protein [Spirochaetaceae bacterium]
MQVVLFGSVASGRAVPSSDADILVGVKDSETPFLDRAALYRDYFTDLGVGVDLFVYTRAEISEGRIPVAAAALRTGIELYRAA